MVNLKTLIETRYEKAREMLRWQLNPSRVMTADEVDDHLDRLNPDLTVAAPLPNEASKPAPSVEQDERGVFAEYRRGVKEAFHIANMIHANRQGRTAEETCSSIVRVLAEMVNSGEARAASTSANVAQGAEAVVGELEAFKAWFKTSGFWNDAITEKAWRAACAWMRKSNSALCESIAQQSRNSLFRSGAKICAGNIRDGAKEPCDLPPTGWYCTRDKGHDGPCAALTAPPAQTALTDDARECLMDVVSHHHDFRTACIEIKAANETTRSDELYWQKQIDVLDRMKAQAERALTAAQSASGESHADKA